MARLTCSWPGLRLIPYHDVSEVLIRGSEDPACSCGAWRDIRTHVCCAVLPMKGGAAYRRLRNPKLQAIKPRFLFGIYAQIVIIQSVVRLLSQCLKISMYIFFDDSRLVDYKCQPVETPLDLKPTKFCYAPSYKTCPVCYTLWTSHD